VYIKYIENKTRFSICRQTTKETSQNMKNTILFLLLFVLLSNIQAQADKNIIIEFESPHLVITKDASNNTYEITGKEVKSVFSNLKYVGVVGDSYQIIDANNEILLIDAETLEKKKEARSSFWLCGTVPHYTIAVEETKNSFVITKDETFYDIQNQKLAEEIFKVSKSDADSIVFINGKNIFNFNANFTYTNKIVDPMTVFLVKDGKYSPIGEKAIKYDYINFEGYSPTLKYSIGNLHGFYKITEAKYSEVSDFQDNLARVTTADGQKIIIDIEGNEYF